MDLFKLSVESNTWQYANQSQQTTRKDAVRQNDALQMIDWADVDRLGNIAKENVVPKAGSLGERFQRRVIENKNQKTHEF